MKRYLLLALTLGLASVAFAPIASASPIDANGDNSISMQEHRLHYLDHSTK